MSASLWLPLVAVLLGQAPAPAVEKPEAALSADRFKPMRMILEDITMAMNSPRDHKAVEAIAEPIYIFDDPTRRLSDGAVWAWGRAGRPAAILSISMKMKGNGERFWLCEATSLASGSITAASKGAPLWDPDAPGITLRPIPKAASPGNDETVRLRQMKELSRRFRAFEYFPPEDSNIDERYELRLLPQPVFRYADSASGLTDGAIFFMVYGRNPEVALLIEASGDRGIEPSWSYALARSGAAVHVSARWRPRSWTQPNVA